MDRKFYTHIKEYDDKYEYYLVRCEFKICYINMDYYGVLRVN